MRRAACALVALALALALAAAPARAQPAARPAVPAKIKVVVAPVVALGGSQASDAARIERLLAGGFAGVAEVALVPSATLAEAMRAVRRPELRACDGEVGCLAELAALVGADQIVHAELGGLGDAEVVFLELVDARARTRVRTTTLELGPERMAEAARAAATRLVVPGRYVGRLTIATRVPGAAVFIDGARIRPTTTLAVGPSTVQGYTLAVGPHALRVTHPDHRDFVRFVDIPFGQTIHLPIDLVGYDVVDRALARTGRPAAPAPREQVVPAPWYRRWPAIAGGGALLFVTSALVVGAIVDGTDADDHATIR